jgi:hypothetical protein
MSTFGDAINAVKSIILIEERVKNQGAKLEKVAELLVEVDRRLVRVETTLDIAMRHAGSAAASPPIAYQTTAVPSTKDGLASEASSE